MHPTKCKGVKDFGRWISSGFLPSLLICALLLSFHRVALAQSNGTPTATQTALLTSVTTYHNDIQRTGWNSNETILTPTNVTPTTFGPIASVALDDQVDAQPLVVANQVIQGQGIHNVVYVATENNSVYAIDGSSGAVLLKSNFGAPVAAPLGCGNNGPNVGITSTPTIDVANQTIYVMTYVVLGPNQPAYQLHALNLQTLGEQPGSPVTVSASATLTDGTSYEFNPSVQRQRAALLESGGNIYAAFASFCGFQNSLSRGWLLGWNAATLAPLNANVLTNSLATAPYTGGWPGTYGPDFFLSSIWMSGFGIADDGRGNLFFATGNSDPSEFTFTGTTNIQQSAVKMPEALTGPSDIFTPSNAATLDQQDLDFGSGGVLVLPDQPGPIPHVAVAAGKIGYLYILNRDAMGGFNNPDVPAAVYIGNCWCGESFYQGSDGVGRVISSGGTKLQGYSWSQAMSWTVNTALIPALGLEAQSPPLAPSAQHPGFFTSISSNGTVANTALIWAVGHPTSSDNHVTLYAFNATQSGHSLAQLYANGAGTWPYLSGDANLVPTVANGKVYVASYKQLAIFGLTSSAVSTIKLQKPTAVRSSVRQTGAQFWGTLKSVNNTQLVLELRNRDRLRVDLSQALATGETVRPIVGKNVAISGHLNAKGVLQANVMYESNADPRAEAKIAEDENRK